MSSELVPAASQELRPGRKTKCTPQVIRIVTDALREGMSANGAMRLAGVSPDCLYGQEGWLHKAERGIAPYDTFLAEATLAIGQAEQRAVQALTKAFNQDWRSASAFLRMRHKEDWSEQPPPLPTVGGVDPAEQVRVELEAMRRALHNDPDPER